MFVLFPFPFSRASEHVGCALEGLSRAARRATSAHGCARTNLGVAATEHSSGRAGASRGERASAARIRALGVDGRPRAVLTAAGSPRVKNVHELSAAARRYICDPCINGAIIKHAALVLFLVSGGQIQSTHRPSFVFPGRPRWVSI